MTFQTDQAWTPATYRKALAAIDANRASETAPRKAKSQSPRHAALQKECRPLLIWRELTHGCDWTCAAANDNDDPTDAEYGLEIRPRIGELLRAIEHVDFETRAHAKLGGGSENVVPIGGDIERGPVQEQGGVKPDCVVRLGRLHFSNGAKVERIKVRDAAGTATHEVRIPLGGLVSYAGFAARERPARKKGAANDNVPQAANDNRRVNSGAFAFTDVVAEKDFAKALRRLLPSVTVAVLDKALVAANFNEVGVMLGYRGKTAERQGKAAVLEACKELEGALAA